MNLTVECRWKHVLVAVLVFIAVPSELLTYFFLILRVICFLLQVSTVFYLVTGLFGRCSLTEFDNLLPIDSIGLV